MTVSTLAPMPPAALAREDAAAYLALGVSTFELLVRERSLPAPRQLSGRRVGWIRAELDAWLLSRPTSELLPPENTSAPKARARRAALAALAANDETMRWAPTDARKAV